MYRSFFCAGALALATAGLAQARPAADADTAAPPAEPPSAAAPAAAAAEALTPGMPVKDIAGQQLGTVNRVGTTPDGVQAVEVSVDGKPVVLAMNSFRLSPAKDEAITTVTKSQALQAAAQQDPPAAGGAAR